MCDPTAKDICDPRPASNSARHLTRTLPPVIKAAAAVVRLLQDLDDDPVAQARFVAVNYTPTGRELLTWDEFCWPSTRSRELAADIRANPDRPRAVWGRVAKAGPRSRDAPDSSQLHTGNCSHRTVPDQPRKCGSPSRGCWRRGTPPRREPHTFQFDPALHGRGTGGRRTTPTCSCSLHVGD